MKKYILPTLFLGLFASVLLGVCAALRADNVVFVNEEDGKNQSILGTVKETARDGVVIGDKKKAGQKIGANLIVSVSYEDEPETNKFTDMVNQFYKILPLKENNSPTLQQYMVGFMRELLGLQSLMNDLNNDGLFANLLGILQYLIDNDCDTSTIKTDVFKAIGIVKKLQQKYKDLGK